MSDKQRKIFVVNGQCGEYSDHRDWPIVAYTEREHAEKHKRLAQEWADENRERAYDEDLKNPYDPDMETSYTGTDYFVTEVDLRDSPPTEVKP